MTWDAAKLDAFETALEKRVRDGLTDDNIGVVAEAEVLGYWLQRLQKCREVQP